MIDEDVLANFKNLPSIFEHKFEKVGLSKWFQGVDSVKKLLGAVVTETLSASMLESPVKLQKRPAPQLQVRVPPLQTRNTDDDVAKSTTNDDREEVPKIRSSCQNTSLFAADMLGQHDLCIPNGIIAAGATPLRSEHRHKNTKITVQRLNRGTGDLTEP